MHWQAYSRQHRTGVNKGHTFTSDTTIAHIGLDCKSTKNPNKQQVTSATVLIYVPSRKFFPDAALLFLWFEQPAYKTSSTVKLTVCTMALKSKNNSMWKTQTHGLISNKSWRQSLKYSRDWSFVPMHNMTCAKMIRGSEQNRERSGH